jgi:hypothetical protein
MNIIFNGPPGSGKDEACEFLVNSQGFKHLSFKDQLFIDTIKFFGVNHAWFMNGYNTNKEIPEKLLNGLSRREAMIYTSEEIMKKRHGRDYYGIQTSKKIDGISSYCFSDGGFVEEVLSIINTVGANNICIVQLFREGCSFSSDSRNYLNGEYLIEEHIINFKSEKEIKGKPILPIRSYQIHNNGNVRNFHQAIRKILRKELDATGAKKDIFRKSV